MQPVIRWTDRIPLISGDAHNLSRSATAPFVSKRVDLRVDTGIRQVWRGYPIYPPLIGAFVLFRINICPRFTLTGIGVQRQMVD